MQYKLRRSREEVLAITADMVAHAASLVNDVAVGVILSFYTKSLKLPSKPGPKLSTFPIP